MNKKTKIAGIALVSFLAILGIITNIVSKMIRWTHWLMIDFNLISYSPWLLITGWVGLIIYWVVTLVKKPFWYYYLVGVLWFIGEIIFTYGIWLTWFT